MKSNKKIPLDFSNINSLFETDPKNICRLLIQSNNIILYDTNSFAFHSIKKERYYALDFFDYNDVVVFIEPVLREMNYKGTEKFPPWYLDYFKELRAKVKSFILLDENQYITLLKSGRPYLKNIEIRIKQAFLSAFEQNKCLEKEIKQLNPTEKNFLINLLNISNKEENLKNRGEIGIFIAIQILCSLKEKANYKIFSDDYTAFLYIKRLTYILERYYPKADIAYLSTVRNIQVSAVTLKLSKKEILEFLNNIEREKCSKLFIRQFPYDTYKRMVQSNEELAQNIFIKKIEVLF